MSGLVKKIMNQPFSGGELNKIFEQLKTANDVEIAKLERKIYDAYLPHLRIVAEKYNVSEEDATDIYAMEFSALFDRAKNYKLSPQRFGAYLLEAIELGCFYTTLEDNKKTEYESLDNYNVAYQATESHNRRETEIEAKRKVIAELAVQLDKMASDKELAKQYRVEPIQIKLVKDYFGIDNGGKGLNIAKLAQKYSMGEMEINTLIRSGIIKIRQMKEMGAFETIQNLNK